MKLRAEAADAFFYTALFVTCDPCDKASILFKSHPSVIVEILSDSTATYDYGKKFAVYRTIDTLKEYIRIDTDTFFIECFRKDTTGHWVLYPVVKGEVLEVAELSFSAPIAELYENVTVTKFVAMSDKGRDI